MVSKVKFNLEPNLPLHPYCLPLGWFTGLDLNISVAMGISGCHNFKILLALTIALFPGSNG